MLQHDRQLKFIAGNLEKKIKTELQKLMDNGREKYEKFFAASARRSNTVLADYGAKKETLQDLLLYWSSKGGQADLAQGICRRHAGGSSISTMPTARAARRCNQLPQMKKLQQKGW